MAALADGKCTGSFSYIFSAEWDYVPSRTLDRYIRDRYSISLSRRLNMIGAVEMLLDHQWVPYHCVEDITAQGAKWDDYEGFTAAGDETALWLYREFLFFSGKVRPLVYNTCDYQEGENKAYLRQIKARKPACVIMEKRMGQGGDLPSRYLLLRKKGRETLLYSLPLTSVQLRLYASGVINLSLCCNDEMDAAKNLIYKRKADPAKDRLEYLDPAGWELTSAQDIAWIRDAGRHLFWPFGCVIHPAETQPADAPVYSALQIGPEPIVLCDYRALYGWAKEKVTKPEHVDWTRRLIGDSCISQMKLKSTETNLPHGDLLVIHSFNDDRMYLHNTIVSDDYCRLIKTGWIYRGEITNANKEGTKKIDVSIDGPETAKEAGPASRHPAPAFREIWQGLKAWYGILATDDNWEEATCQDAETLIRKCEEATDARWIDHSTLYGLYYNAMTQLVDSTAPSFLSRNMDWMYYQMFLLAIMQRSSIQRFYREASGAAVHRANHKAGNLSEALKEKYVFFMNSMWFTEVTEQEQGCDFFDRLRENMGLTQDMELLKDAIEDLNSVTEKNLENAVNNALLPATFIGLALSAFDGLSHLFGQATETETGLNAFSIPFPWALTGVSCGIALAMWIYYLLRKR